MANEDGNTRSYRYEKDWPNNNSVISVRTKYPERVVELLNWMYTEEGRMITNFGEEGVNYTVDEDGTIVTSQDMIDAQQVQVMWQQQSEVSSDLAFRVLHSMLMRVWMPDH